MSSHRWFWVLGKCDEATRPVSCNSPVKLSLPQHKLLDQASAQVSTSVAGWLRVRYSVFLEFTRRADFDRCFSVRQITSSHVFYLACCSPTRNGFVEGPDGKKWVCVLGGVTPILCTHAHKALRRKNAHPSSSAGRTWNLRQISADYYFCQSDWRSKISAKATCHLEKDKRYTTLNPMTTRRKRVLTTTTGKKKKNERAQKNKELVTFLTLNWPKYTVWQIFDREKVGAKMETT